MCSAISVHVKESIQVEDCERELFHARRIVRFVGQKLQRERALACRGRAARGCAEREVHAIRRSRALLQDSRGKCGGEVVRSLAIEQFEGLRSVRGLLAPRTTEQRVRRVEYLL